MTKNERIIAAFKEMDENEVIRIWNEYCSETNRYDDAIMDGYEMEEWVNNTDDVMNVLNRFYFGDDDGNEGSSANPNRNYFTFNGYGNIISFNYIYNSYTDEFSYIYVEDLADYIIENENAFSCDEIQEILDDENEE